VAPLDRLFVSTDNEDFEASGLNVFYLVQKGLVWQNGIFQAKAQ
jgi:hypothetical protein